MSIKTGTLGKCVWRERRLDLIEDLIHQVCAMRIQGSIYSGKGVDPDDSPCSALFLWPQLRSVLHRLQDLLSNGLVGYPLVAAKRGSSTAYSDGGAISVQPDPAVCTLNNSLS